MEPRAEVAVTLSGSLYRQLRAEARRLGVPLSWLVASLVVDTIDGVPTPGKDPVAA